MKRLAVLVAALTVSACGGGSDGPSAAPTPQIAQVGGVWAYSRTLTGVTGGDCVGALLSVGTVERGSLQITQTGSALTATATDDSTGTNCTYTGTAGASSFALNGTFCSLGTIRGVRCTTGALRDMTIQSLGINASIAGVNASGTTAQTWNITTTAGAGAGILTLNGSFTATKR